MKQDKPSHQPFEMLLFWLIMADLVEAVRNQLRDS